MSDHLQRQLHEVEIDFDQLYHEVEQGLVWAIKGEGDPSLPAGILKISYIRSWDNHLEFFGYTASNKHNLSQIERIKKAIDEASVKAYQIWLLTEDIPTIH